MESWYAVGTFGLPLWQSTYLQAIAALVFTLLLELRLPVHAALPNGASLPLIAYGNTGMARITVSSGYRESNVSALTIATCS
jgi:hypothetical protein